MIDVWTPLQVECISIYLDFMFSVDAIEVAGAIDEYLRQLHDPETVSESVV